MLRLILICLLFSFVHGTAFAQSKSGQARLDSLLAELPRAKPDTNRVKLLYRISSTYATINPTEGVNYANQCLILAQRLMMKKYIANAYNMLGINHQNLSDFPKALIAFTSGLKIAEEMKNKQFISIFTGNTGMVYSGLADYPKALGYYEKGLKAEEELGDKIGQISSLANIAEVHLKLGDYAKALVYNQRSLKLNEALNFPSILKEAHLTAIGLTYVKMADYPKAFDYLQRSLRINQASGEKALRASLYFALSSLYYKIATDSSSASLAILIGENKTSALRKANRYIDSTMVLANEFGVQKAFYEVYKTQSEIQDALGEPKAALATFKQYINTKDLIFNQDNTNKIASAALQYDFDKKETALKFEQQLTVVQLQKQTLLTKQQAQELSLKVQAAQLANKELDVQRLQYLQEKAAKQDKEKQLELSQREQALKATALELSQAEVQSKNQERTYLLGGFGLLTTLLGFIVYGYAQKQKANTLLQRQKEEINQKSSQLEQSLIELRATQTQLVQKEKMASLGELTAGIAHEIQNPLNFVNNFAEVSAELVTELEEEQLKPERDADLETDILLDLKNNLQKINHHGGRASAIVRGMLEHSRTSTGEKRPTDLNALADEYLKIAYQGLRAKDKDYNADLITNFDPAMGKLEVMPQEIGRVLLNLYNNAFYAVSEKQKTAPPDYQPTVTVSTRLIPHSPERAPSIAHPNGVGTHVVGSIEIRVSDNGTGIPESVKAKIFQPFFTTKPTGEGTGLGLSLSYDIITKGHGGSLRVESQHGEGSTFVIQLPSIISL